MIQHVTLCTAVSTKKMSNERSIEKVETISGAKDYTFIVWVWGLEN